jgi:hypothetical protein
MRQVLINGRWESPPPGVDIQEWVYEIIAVELDMVSLMPKRWVQRFELIRAVRKSPRHKAVPVRVVRNID